MRVRRVKYAHTCLGDFYHSQRRRLGGDIDRFTLLGSHPEFPAPTATAVPPARTLSVTEEVTDVPTALPVASPPSAEPLLHTVREGDTLGGIAQAYDVSVEALIAVNNLVNPDVLAVGQTLVIPVDGVHTPTPISLTEAETEPTHTPTPLSTVLPTLTPSGPPLVEIGQVLGSGDLAAEVVIVRNRGGAANLEEWTLADAEGKHLYLPGAHSVHRRRGASTFGCGQFDAQGFVLGPREPGLGRG